MSSWESLVRARQSGDIPSLVLLLSCGDVVETEGLFHEWADNPKTTGAMALLELFRCELHRHPEKKRVFIECSGLVRVINCLRIAEQDRQDIAALVLADVLAEDEDVCNKAIENGVLSALLPLLKNQKAALCVLVSQILTSLLLSCRSALESRLCYTTVMECLLGMLQRVDPSDAVFPLQTILELVQPAESVLPASEAVSSLIQQEGLVCVLRCRHNANEEVRQIVSDIEQAVKSFAGDELQVAQRLVANERRPLAANERRPLAANGSRRRTRLYVENKSWSSNHFNVVANFAEKKLRNAELERDVSTVIQMVGSRTAILETSHRVIHPWVTDPSTIGARALQVIANWASKDVDLRKQLLSYHVIESIVEQLADSSPDVQEAATLALLFLCEEDLAACREAVIKGSITILLPLLTHPKEDMRLTVLATVACLCLTVQDVHQFISYQDVIGAIVPLLDEDSEETRFETTCTLLDLIQPVTQGQRLNRSVADAIVSSDGLVRLRRCLSSVDEEFYNSCHELIQLLELS